MNQRLGNRVGRYKAQGTRAEQRSKGEDEARGTYQQQEDDEGVWWVNAARCVTVEGGAASFGLM